MQPVYACMSARVASCMSSSAITSETAKRPPGEFHKGYIEEIPLPDASVDVVISNCVINLSGDKPKVLREVARVIAPTERSPPGEE